MTAAVRQRFTFLLRAFAWDYISSHNVNHSDHTHRTTPTHDLRILWSYWNVSGSEAKFLKALSGRCEQLRQQHCLHEQHGLLHIGANNLREYCPRRAHRPFARSHATTLSAMASGQSGATGRSTCRVIIRPSAAPSGAPATDRHRTWNATVHT